MDKIILKDQTSFEVADGASLPFKKIYRTNIRT